MKVELCGRADCRGEVYGRGHCRACYIKVRAVRGKVPNIQTKAAEYNYAERGALLRCENVGEPWLKADKRKNPR